MQAWNLRFPTDELVVTGSVDSVNADNRFDAFWFVVGSGYDYRLMFLLLPLGALVREISKSKSARALPVALLLVAYQLSLYKKVSEIPYLMDPVVFVVCCAWLGRCLLTTEASSMSEQRVAVAN